MHTLVIYSGPVRGLKSHMAALLYPEKIVSLAAYRAKKKTANRRPTVKCPA